jgi:hypothetical protein
MLMVAGLPLIARQIEWLLHMGCDGVIVEASGDSASRAVARWVDAHCGDGSDVLVVTTGEEAPIGAREVAGRAGIGAHRPVLAIPADLVGDGDLTYMVPVPNRFGVVAFFDAPKPLMRRLGGGTVRLVRAPLGGASVATRGQPTPVRGPGWAARVQSSVDAAALTIGIWQGEVPGIEAAPTEVQRVA